MDNLDDNEPEDLPSTIYIFPPNVQAVIEQVLPSSDPLDQPNFNTVDYINSLFPTEQSLSNIDDEVSKMEYKICEIDKEIRSVVRGQTNVGEDGRAALEDAQKVIKQLFVHIKDIKDKAERSEETVKEITRDIKQLDFAKRNLTASITALNHLHMLVDGVDNLKLLTQSKKYGEIINPLEAILEVMQHFKNYIDIPQIKQLSDEVRKIQVELAQQITADFKETFSGQNSKNFTQITKGCTVLSILDNKIKKDLLTWFVNMQLQEYAHLFSENQDFAWLDKIDRRYAWIKKHLLEFESKFGMIFPRDWEVSERIAVQFCHNTREDLTKLMEKRKSEIDVKLLLYAIQKTNNFESLLSKRFSGVTLGNCEPTKNTDVQIQQFDDFEEKVPGNPFEEETEEKTVAEKSTTSPFANLIRRCFEPYFSIYIESLDRNLASSMDKFVNDYKTHPPDSRHFNEADGSNSVLSSCADLFVLYKNYMLQSTQLSTGVIMISLAETFQKYLKEYAVKMLQNNLPKIGGRDFRDLTTAGLIQNFQSLLKEGETSRFSKEEQTRICCILTTAEYCLETTQQLEDKLREKTDKLYADKISFSQEQDNFHNVISNCIQLLVQDLESGCEPALTTMTKMPWSTIETVGDQSSYVSVVVAHLRQTVPPIRDSLSSCRKYFTQLCVKFASSFILKLMQQLYKCKPLSTVGAEQLLLDVHMLKTALLELPSTGWKVQRKAPATYTKVVIKGMAKAELILKIVMSSTEVPDAFISQSRKLLPDLQSSEFQKILDMKGLKKTEQTPLLEEFKQRVSSSQTSEAGQNSVPDNSEQEAGRIKRLEKLIKNRM